MKRILALGALAAHLAFCQFDAVSIRPSAPDARGGGFNLSPGRLNGKNTSLKELVKFAYDLHDYQLSGGIGWTEADHYEIMATFPATATDAQRRVMLQAMLADRFQLAIHREQKEISGYALVVLKNGPKFHAAEPGQPGMMLGRSATTGQRTLTGTSAKMPDLASILADLLSRPVEDKTGLDGIFDFKMEWTPDPVSEGPMRKGVVNQEQQADGQTGPSIFTALQESLGLRLETGKTPVEVVVIDHAEKPSAN